VSTSADNPFPGPVPLTEGQGGLLFGREAEKDELEMRLRPGSPLRIVQLTADSGIGKTSLLDAGLVPRLKGSGRKVILIRDWSAVSGRRGVDNLAEALMAGLGPAACEDVGVGVLHSGTESDQGNAEEIIDVIDDHYGEDLVVILDQFEELFRLDPSLGHEFLAALVERYARRQPLSFRTVVSLRSEYRSELGVIESKLSTDRWLWYPLSHVEDEVVVDLICAHASEGPQPFERDEAQVLQGMWLMAAYGAKGQDRGKWWKPRVGLLQMQAMLWVLWERMRRESYTLLTWESVLEALGAEHSPERSRAGEEKEATEAFQAALRAFLDEAFDALLGKAGDGSYSKGRDRAEGEARARETRVMAALLAPALSSGGYKQVVDTDELALSRTAVGFQFFDRPEEKAYARAAIQRARHVAESEGSRFLSFENLEDDFALFVGGPPDEFSVRTDEGEDQALGAGRLMTRHWQVVTCEIALTYERALQWLKQRQIVRLTPGPWRDGNRTRAVSVTHDGYGEPLNAWGKHEMTKPETYEHMLVALRGETIELPCIQAPVDGPPIVLKRLSWQGAEIAFDLVNVVFEECDLRGTVIQGVSRLQDVEFRNCVTDGLLIQRSTIRGRKGLLFVGDDRCFDLELKAAKSFNTRVRTLTLQNECEFEAGTPLVFKGLTGYGVFVTETTGAAWSIINCELDHVVIGSEPHEGRSWRLNSGKIVNAFLSHLVLRGDYTGGSDEASADKLARVADSLGVAVSDLGVSADALNETKTVRVANASLIHVEAERVKLSGDWIWMWREQRQDGETRVLAGTALPPRSTV
jgi:hypothetical protein